MKNGSPNTPQHSVEYYSVIIQLDYESSLNGLVKDFFTSIYYELTFKHRFNFSDRVFVKADSMSNIVASVKDAVSSAKDNLNLSNEEINKIIRHAFVIPVAQFNDVKKMIT